MAEAPTEAKIQSMAQNMDVGIGSLILRRVMVFVLIGMVCLYYPATQFRGVNNDEAMDHLQLARNLSLGRGYVTDVVRPLQIWFLQSVVGEPVVPLPEMKELFRAPFYPAVLSLILRGASVIQGPQELFFPGPEEIGRRFPIEMRLLLPFGVVLFVLSVLMTYRMGRLLFDQRVAFTSLWLFFLCDDLWKAALSGRPFVLVLFLVTLSLYTLLKGSLRHEQGPGWLAAWVYLMVSAVSIALAGITYYSLILLWLPWLIVVWRSYQPHSGRALFMGLGAMGCVLLPVVLLNLHATRVPYGVFGLAPLSMFADTPMASLRSLQESLRPDFSSVGIGGFLIKWMLNLREAFVGHVKDIGDGWMMGAFMAILPFRFRKVEVNRFRWLTFWMIGLVMIGAAAVGQQGHFMLGKALYPLVLLYGVGFFYLMLDRLDIRVSILRRLAIMAFVFLNISGFLLTFLGPRVPDQFPPYSPRHIILGLSNEVVQDARLRMEAKSGSDGRLLVVSDLPEAVAWYGGERTLMLPAQFTDFAGIHDFYHEISVMYISPRFRNLKPLDDLSVGGYRDWAQLALGQVGNPARFPLDHHLRYVGYPLQGENAWAYFLYDRPARQSLIP